MDEHRNILIDYINKRFLNEEKYVDIIDIKKQLVYF